MTKQTQNTEASLEASEVELANQLASQEEVEELGQDSPIPDEPISTLTYGIDTLSREALKRLEDRVSELEAAVPASAPSNTSLSFLGFNFNLRVLPKQDIMLSGMNSLGRQGLALELIDTDRTYIVAKLEWDHVRQAYVLYTGKGVAG